MSLGTYDYIFYCEIDQQSPSMMWIDVVRELDGGELLLKDRAGLNLLITALKLGLQSQGYPIDRFPIDLFYRPWKHPESQVPVKFQNLIDRSDLK